MQRILCDGCGKELKRHALRYHVKIEVQAAYDTLEISLLDLVRNHRREIESLIDRLGDKSAQELEESVYKAIQLDLCPSCQARFIRHPMKFQQDSPLPPTEFDVDAFLRSLGKSTDNPPT